MTSLEKLIVAYDCSNLSVLQQQQSMWDNFCVQLGERLINMGGRVHVKGYNLNSEGLTAEKTLQVDTSNASYLVGLEFMMQLFFIRSIDQAYLLYVGKHDTKKSFSLIVPSHNCVATFEVRKKR